MSMRLWFAHKRKLVTAIVVLFVIALAGFRLYLIPDVTPAGATNWPSMVKSIVDNLISTIVVTASVTAAITWFTSPTLGVLEESFVLPVEIEKTLRLAATDTRDWHYVGHTGEYIRSSILPIISRESAATGVIKHIRIVILDPDDSHLCDMYAKYRGQKRSLLSNGGQWSVDGVRRNLLATVLCAVELHQKNDSLNVEIGFHATLSIFRVDMSSTLALVTQAESQQPAILHPAGSDFYASYHKECELAWRQCRKLDVSLAVTDLDYSDVTTIRSTLQEMNIETNDLTDEALTAIGAAAARKVSPYA